MPKIANKKRAVMLAVTTALATTMLGGYTAIQAAEPADVSASKAEEALARGKTSDAITHAEATVKSEPNNAKYRAMLGAVYMEAGRFQSAATSFQDAIDLGDSSGRTALSLALAQIGSGQQAPALATLGKYNSSIDPSDLGLAMSLAGRPEQGVRILSDALRGGATNAKVRQNLAYSYALMGDWRSARLMAAEDVPADQVGDRMSEWAQTAAPEAYQARVASLLNVPVTRDSGQPAMLALSDRPAPVQMASANIDKPLPSGELPAVGNGFASNSASASAATSSSGFAAAMPSYALPPLGGGQTGTVSPGAVPSSTAPSVVPSSGAASGSAFAQASNEEPASFAEAFVGNSQPQTTRAQTGQPRSASGTARVASNKQAQSSRSANTMQNGDHLIQLGSFSSEAGAKRALDIYAARYPQLANYEMVISKARVRGKTYYRVSAGGFERASANAMCSSVKTDKQGCITWAANAPLPGAIDRGIRMARS